MSRNRQSGLKLLYWAGGASIEELQEEISRILAELGDPDSELSRVASERGIASHEFAGSQGIVDQEGKGFGDVVVAIVILAPSINHAVRNIWDDLIWPSLRSRLGADAVGSEVDSDEGAEQDDSDEDIGE